MFRNQRLDARTIALPGGVDLSSGPTTPVDGPTGTGSGHAGPGSQYVATVNGRQYTNVGTKASPVWVEADSAAFVLVTKANILAMFATPVVVVPPPGVGRVIELLNAVIIYDFAGAAYAGGGPVRLAYSGAGPDLTDTIVAANLFGAAADKVYRFAKLDPAGGTAMPSNAGIVITNATAAFTDPGTAAGVARLQVSYRTHATGL